MELLRELLRPWAWKMAWRDARRSAARLVSSAATIALGIAALVAVGSLSSEVASAVERESKGLLGADLAFRARQPFGPAVEAKLTELEADGATLSRQLSFTTAASFPRSGAVRQARVRAVSGGYPFYGAIESDPPGAAAELAAGRGALVDASLLAFGGAAIGDPVKIGTREIPIAGAIVKIPGETATAALFGARVYVPADAIDPALLDRGSQVNYVAFVKLKDGAAPDAADSLRRSLDAFARDENLSIDTANSAESSWERSADRLHDFLHLAALAALLLGGLGVGSAMHLHARRKREVVATLRCLGCTADRAFAAFAAQALVLGLLGTTLGAALGVGLHLALPALFRDFLPVALGGEVSPRAVLAGCIVGIGFALGAALWPLSELKHVPPLLALRGTPESAGTATRPLAAARYLLALLTLVAAFGALETRRVGDAFAYAGFLALAFGALAAVGAGTVWLARRVSSRALPFAWRFGIANLQRPDNQTPALLLTLGLGAFLLATIDQSEAQLYAVIDRATKGVQPNLVLFDVQNDQVADVRALLAERSLPVIEDVPFVTMRIAAVRGRPVAELKRDRERRSSSWALGREYRSTYRATLSDTEETVTGEWRPAERTDPGRPFPVSLEEDIARRLDVAIGDSITWDVAGVPVETEVVHLRRIDWGRMKANFFAVFAPGALDGAPQFHVVTTRVEGDAAMSEAQRALAERFPGISVIDVGLILSVVDDLVSRIGLVLRSMGLLCVLTGGLVLLGAWLGSRRERLVESALLRALGASRATVRTIATVEAAAIGLLAAIAGSALGIAASAALARWRFDLTFTLDLPRLLAVAGGVMAFGVLIASFAGRGVHREPPLEVLREEG